MRLRVDASPRWVELGLGVAVEVAPVRSDVMLEARRDDAVREAAEAGASGDLLALAMARAVARRTILSWRGVSGEDGEPLETSPEAIDALLGHWRIFEAWQSEVMAPALGVESEGNG